ncbi:MAG: M23 family metallopeptidase [Erysipelotrichales bacterium]|nr:M23 family metallopeptidase [Erysipelotrichales bacterium]
MSLFEIKNLLKRMFICIILFFILTIVIDDNLISSNTIVSNHLDFSYIRSKTNMILGSFINKDNLYVSSEKIIYKDISPYYDGYRLIVDKNYIIKSLRSGVVVFIGNKENYGLTIIINCDDGTNISYSNLENINVNLYDYINKDTIIGSTVNNELYLVFEKNKEYLSYEEYL